MTNRSILCVVTGTPSRSTVSTATAAALHDAQRK
jgi:hypothetical protein